MQQEELNKKTRFTRQKSIILETLQKNKEVHFSADELVQCLKNAGCSIGLATVYRNLKRFEEDGQVIRIITGEESSVRYQAASDGEEVHSHHHLICTKCGKIQDFDVDLLDKIEKLVTAQKDFVVTNHQLIFYGVCSNCNKKHGKEEKNETSI